MSGQKFGAHWDDDLDCWCVYDPTGAIVARSCADRHTAEDVADAMNAAADLDSQLIVAMTPSRANAFRL